MSLGDIYWKGHNKLYQMHKTQSKSSYHNLATGVIAWHSGNVQSNTWRWHKVTKHLGQGQKYLLKQIGNDFYHDS